MTIGIVGLGLIGGSIGLALHEPDRKIVGYDPNPDSIKTAKDRFCIDAAASLEDVAQSDVVFIAVPPVQVIATLNSLQKTKAEKTVMTDCTSVKAGVVQWAIDSREPNFVVGHPMAGHENSGAAFASAWMFRGAKWILCPIPSTNKDALKTVESLIKAMSATPVRMKPEAHDRQVATLSHLPHAIAGVLVQMRAEFDGDDVSGGSWRDLTRVGGVDPALWTQIFTENRVELSKAIKDFEAKLSQLRATLDANDTKAIKTFFEEAKKAKKKEK